MFVGNGIADGVCEGVIDGIRGGGLDVVVAITAGVAEMLPQASTKNTMSAPKNAINTRFCIVINRSISTSNYKYNH